MVPSRTMSDPVMSSVDSKGLTITGGSIRKTRSFLKPLSGETIQSDEANPVHKVYKKFRLCLYSSQFNAWVCHGSFTKVF